MIQKVTSLEAYESLVAELADHPLYHDPHYKYCPNIDYLYKQLRDDDSQMFGIWKDGAVVGLFNWLILPKDRYVEMLIGFTKSEEAFSEMLADLEAKYPGYQMDFVVNPKNPAILPPLKAKGAAFDTEQQKMLHPGTAPKAAAPRIVRYSDAWKDAYCALHHKDVYWTAERILSTENKFHVLLAIEDGELQGYLDVTCCHGENEIYCLFVRPEAENRGLEQELLAAAIEWNGPHPMMVLVDVDQEKEIAHYTQAGFAVQDGFNCVVATISDNA